MSPLRGRRNSQFDSFNDQSQTLVLTRTGGSPPDPATVVQRAGPFGAAVRNASTEQSPVTLITVRDDKGLDSYITVPRTKEAANVIATLGSAISAKATEVEQAPDLDTDAVGWLVAKPSKWAARTTQAGGDQSEVAILLSRIMRPGNWVAVTLRPPTKREVGRVREWFKYRRDGSTAHYSQDLGPVVTTFYAGADTDDEVENLLAQLTSAIPGFDIESEVPTRHSRISFRPVAAVAVALAVAVGIFSHKPLYGLVTGLLALAVGYIASIAPTGTAQMDKAIAEALARGQLPAPPKRLVPPTKPTKKTIKNSDGSSRQVERAGGYPLNKAAFFLGPAMVTGIVSPHAGTASGIAETEERLVPEALTEDVGPVIGYATDRDVLVPVHLDSSETQGGIMVWGKPNTGKTQFITNQFAFNLLERIAPSGKPGRPGRNNAIIAFEHKGEGVETYLSWSGALRGDLIVVEVGDPNSPAIDITFPGLPASKRAEKFVSAMVCAFGEDAIQFASQKVLRDVLTAAFACPASIAEEFADKAIEGPVSFISVAHMLLGGREDAIGVDLHNAMYQHLEELDKESPEWAELDSAIRGLSSLYGEGVKPNARGLLTKAPVSKIDMLARLPEWWDPKRVNVTWQYILGNNLVIVLNTGSTRAGHNVDSSISAVLSAMTSFSLQGAISETCSGWQKIGRSVSIFSDELSLLVKNSSEVVEWLRDQGRSYGIKLYLATQRPEQLTAGALRAVESIETVLWFQSNDRAIIDPAIRKLSLGGDEWSSEAIANLPQYSAVAIIRAKGRSQPGVTVKMGYWADEPTKFIEDQGYA